MLAPSDTMGKSSKPVKETAEILLEGQRRGLLSIS